MLSLSWIVILFSLGLINFWVSNNTAKLWPLNGLCTTYNRRTYINRVETSVLATRRERDVRVL